MHTSFLVPSTDKKNHRDSTKAMSRYQQLKNITSIARTVEFFFAAMLLSRSISLSSTYFPAAVEFCCFLCRRLCMVLVSQHFVFLIGNLILVTLFIKYSHSSEAGISDGDEEECLIGQFAPPPEIVPSDFTSEVTVSDKHTTPTEIKVPSPSESEKSSVHSRKSEPRRNRRTRSEAGISDGEEYLISQFTAPPEIVPSKFISEMTISDEKHTTPTEKVPLGSDSEKHSVQRKKPEPRRSRRTRSEEFGLDVTEKIQHQRSETEIDLKKDRSGDWRKVEDLSNEEFQRKVEAFIERQQRFLRDESSSLVNRNSFSA